MAINPKMKCEFCNLVIDAGCKTEQDISRVDEGYCAVCESPDYGFDEEGDLYDDEEDFEEPRW